MNVFCIIYVIDVFIICRETLGYSASTGYDWTHTSQVTQSEQVTVTVEDEVPPGEKW